MNPDPVNKTTPEIYSHTALRGIAALYVALFHLGWNGSNHEQNNAFFQFFHFGGYAVDLFFILSGFILNWVYLSNSKINWPNYLQARAARILPLYFLTTLLYLPIPVWNMIKQGLASVGKDYPFVLIVNLLPISGIVDGWRYTINGPAWSVSVECFCYVCIFPILYLARKMVERTDLIILASVFLTVVCVTLYETAPIITIFGFPWDSAWLLQGVFEFSSGFLMCAIFRKFSVRTISNWMVDSVFIATFVVFIFSLLGFASSNLLLAAFPALVFFAATDKGILCKLLKLAPFQWLGGRSYSIYLWHMPLLISSYHLKPYVPQIVINGLFVVSVLGVAEISYRFFECPCREYIRKFSFSLVK